MLYILYICWIHSNSPICIALPPVSSPKWQLVPWQHRQSAVEFLPQPSRGFSRRGKWWLHWKTRRKHWKTCLTSLENIGKHWKTLETMTWFHWEKHVDIMGITGNITEDVLWIWDISIQGGFHHQLVCIPGDHRDLYTLSSTTVHPEVSPGNLRNRNVGLRMVWLNRPREMHRGWSFSFLPGLGLLGNLILTHSIPQHPIHTLW